MNNDINRIIKDFEVYGDTIIVHFRKSKDCTFDYNINVFKAIIEKMDKQHEKEAKLVKKYFKCLKIYFWLAFALVVIVLASSIIPSSFPETVNNIILNTVFYPCIISILPAIFLARKIDKFEESTKFLNEKKKFLVEYEKSINETKDNKKEETETKTEQVALALNPEPIKYESNMVRTRTR